MKSLFNDEIPDVPPKKAHGKFATWKQENCYRKTRGDKKCENCKYFCRVIGHTRDYFKCALMGASSSEATDIRASYVCNQFKQG